MIRVKWYVKRHDFNTDQIVDFNIFDSSKFNDCLDKLMADEERMKDFKENLRRILSYCFWCKSEYEVMMSGFKYFNEKKFIEEFEGKTAEEVMDLYEQCVRAKDYKIDVYSQVLPNIDILAEYILANYHNEKN